MPTQGPFNGSPREPERIDRILGLILTIWKQHPQLRLGQLLANATVAFEGRTYFIEDTEVEAALKRVAKEGF